jgi:hypothetical protein
MKHTHLKVLVSLLLLMPISSWAENKSCTIKYNLTGWSFFYQGYKGTGVVSCTNGQSARVNLTLHGGGLTLGVIDIENAKGKFTKFLVRDSDRAGCFLEASFCVEKIQGIPTSRQAI